jgi:hypothetical protein
VLLKRAPLTTVSHHSSMLVFSALGSVPISCNTDPYTYRYIQHANSSSIIQTLTYEWRFERNDVPLHLVLMGVLKVPRCPLDERLARAVLLHGRCSAAQALHFGQRLIVPVIFTKHHMILIVV